MSPSIALTVAKALVRGKLHLGTDTPAAHFVQAVQEHAPDVVAMSALMTTTMLAMSEVVSGLEQAWLRDRVKVIIGGAPASVKFAAEIVVDAYAATAPEGVAVVRALLRD
ncbi:MAG: cobalamin-dependent protein [Anaerolineae bacterium]|jgi:5-methyltetrahydrofolate--homocysteine methyltransferase